MADVGTSSTRPTRLAGRQPQGLRFPVSVPILLAVAGLTAVVVGVQMSRDPGPAVARGGTDQSRIASPAAVQATADPRAGSRQQSLEGKLLTTIALGVFKQAERTHPEEFDVARALNAAHEHAMPEVGRFLSRARVFVNPDPAVWQAGDWGSAAKAGTALVVSVSPAIDGQSKRKAHVVYGSGKIEDADLSAAEILERASWFRSGVELTVPEAPVNVGPVGANVSMSGFR